MHRLAWLTEWKCEWTECKMSVSPNVRCILAQNPCSLQLVCKLVSRVHKVSDPSLESWAQVADSTHHFWTRPLRITHKWKSLWFSLNSKLETFALQRGHYGHWEALIPRHENMKTRWHWGGESPPFHKHHMKAISRNWPVYSRYLP